VGFDLGTYEQPPMPEGRSAEAYPPPPPPPLPTKEATAGLAFSVVGLAAAPLQAVFTFALAVSGILLSSYALREFRRGLAGGRRRAIAGLVLGILGIALVVLVFMDYMTGSTTISAI
jgi:hypothetical protein